MKITIVTTTVQLPSLLLKYAENARYYGHRDVDLIVVGTRQSAPETADFCKNLQPHCRCSYWDLLAQQEWLADFPKLSNYLRSESIERGMVGMLMAWQNGADVVVAINDDHSVTTQDFIGIHRTVGTVGEHVCYGSTSGWLNVCSFLQADDSVRFYPRGFPSKNRWTERDSFVTQQRANRRVVVNAGLGLDEADVDAVVRLTRTPVVRGFKSSWKGNIALQPGTWSPFNSQNTAFVRDLIPAYFLCPQLGRYGDIWASYIVNRITEQLGDLITFGEPLLRQNRGSQDVWADLDQERNGMMLTDDFCAALRSIPLAGVTYHECFGEIAAQLPLAWTPDNYWTDAQKALRLKLVEGLDLWHEAFDKLGAGLRGDDSTPVPVAIRR